MNFVAIGEFVKRLSVELTEEYNEIPWIKIYGLRNIFAHNYFGVDAEEVWQIIQTELDSLVQDIKGHTRETNVNLRDNHWIQYPITQYFGVPFSF